MLGIFDAIIISPISEILGFFYLLFLRVSHIQGAAIIGMSLVMNLLCLPLYAKAEQWMQAERNIKAKLKPKIDSINAVFKGDEKLMILSTYYRQNHYHPVYSVRSSFGLLLQIPFFIAAFVFITNLKELQGQSFWIIKDLSHADGLLSIAGLKINLVPLLMTILNIAASAVYLKGQGLSSKIQLYVIAGIFMVLLYSSPSALVIYWTINNIFSLLKNLVSKTKHPLRVFYGIVLAAAVLATGVSFFSSTSTPRKNMVILALCAIIALAPIFRLAALWLYSRFLKDTFKNMRSTTMLFVIAALSWMLLASFVIPTSLVAQSPQEFFSGNPNIGPSGLLGIVFLQGFGVYLLWPACIFLLFGNRIKILLATAVVILLACALADAYLFKGDYGLISRQFSFNDPGLLKADNLINAINIIALLFLAAITFLIITRFPKIAIPGTAIILASMIVMFVINMISVSAGYTRFMEISASAHAALDKKHITPVLHLGKDKQNVMVIMLDRAISAFVPMLMEKDPALKKEYSGFIFYPNTLSYSGHTLAGAPPLFGGYDYTPEKINERPRTSLVTKHNEALATMPRLFAESGWESTIIDASWANYSWIPDNRIFAQFKGVRAFNIEGAYTNIWFERHGLKKSESGSFSRNMMWFGLFRMAPMAIRFGLYDSGKWWDSGYTSDAFNGYIDSFAPLEYFGELVDYTAKEKTFALIVNNAAHDTLNVVNDSFLPDKNGSASKPKAFADSEAWDIYRINGAALQALGKFFNSLRANAAWDNTRVIIVSDHGFAFSNPAFNFKLNNSTNPSSFNAFLMVKDFGAQGEFSVDNRFGTNADTPALAAVGIDNPKNPFTGNKIDTLHVGDEVKVFAGNLWDPMQAGKFAFPINAGELWNVRKDIFDRNNWEMAR